MITSLSILFPIYNEERRIKISLKKIESFLNKKLFKKIEIILINDGSTDLTINLINSFLLKSINKKKIKLVSIKKNQGKGYALKEGIKYANNDWILTADIDLSVKLEQLNEWERKFIKKNIHVYFASRSHRLSIVNKNILRNILGGFFKVLSFLLFDLKIDDTQCGFKLYKKNIAKKIFRNLYEKGYVHDVEISYKCLKKQIKIIELPVKWVHKSDGKINIFLDPFKMLISLIKLKIILN